MPGPTITPSGDGLNANHQRRLQAMLQQLDRGLGEMLGLAQGADPEAVFPDFALDLSPAERQEVAAWIGHARGAMKRIAADLGLPPTSPRSGVSWAIRARLLTLEIDLEETMSGSMKGYGALPEPAAKRLDAALGELRDLLGGLLAYLTSRAPDDAQDS